MRSKFDEQLALLNRDLTKMGSLCEEALALAAKALANADGQTAAKIAPIDSEIDQMERTIESLCLKLLLQQQPVARDLRQISAALKMITDMERIGDQASDIAEIIGFLNGRIGTDAQYICQMAVAAMRMVTESVEAYVKRDVAMAEATIQHDDVVDDLFLKVKESLIQMIYKQCFKLNKLVLHKFAIRMRFCIFLNLVNNIFPMVNSVTSFNIVNIKKIFFNPLLVWVLFSNFALYFFIRNNSALLSINKEHLARLKTFLSNNARIINIKNTNFRR